MTLLLVGTGGFALYYYMFSEQQTAYYSGRNGRMVGRLAQQVRRAINSMGRIASGAANIPDQQQIVELYKFQSSVPEAQRPAQALFNDIAVHPTETVRRDEQRFWEQHPNGPRLVFEGKSAPAPDEQATLTPGRPEQPAAKGTQRYVRATIDFKRMMDTLVRQNAAGVFDTVFILDDAGNVIYQSPPPANDDSDADLKIVRVKELRSRRHFFENEETVPLAELLSASRQMAVRIGSDEYQLFSFPLRSSIDSPERQKAAKKESPKETEKKDAPPAAKPPEPEVPSDLWVVCGLVSSADFRSRSLAISPTLLACLGAAVLLIVCSWPFLKLALSGSQHKVTLADVVLVGIGGVLGTALVCLIALDLLAFRRLEAVGDGQLAALAKKVEANLDTEIGRSIEELDAMQEWIERQLLQPSGIRVRNADLLSQRPPASLTRYPFFQSFALIGRDGQQKAKWTAEAPAPPLVGASYRTYFSAPYHEGPEYLSHRKGKLTVESIRSATSEQPEVAFSRRTADGHKGTMLSQWWPVIVRTAPAISVIRPLLPPDLEFAIVDAQGMVQFHSQSDRNLVENFFAEADQNRALMSAVGARQSTTLNIRYWGEDYRAYLRPMKTLPWTVIAFRHKAAMRGVNTEALMIAVVLLLAMYGPALLGFICFVLLFRPRYRAPWLWPDRKRVGAYVELGVSYLVLLAAALILLLRLGDAVLLAFPFAFVPLVLTITYLYLRPKLRGTKRVSFIVVAAAFTAWLLALLWSGSDGRPDLLLVVAAILLLAAPARAALRTWRHDSERAAARPMALPLGYVAAGFLLLLLTSVVPTISFFKAAYEMEIDTYVKWNQMKLGRDLQDRWWRITGEFSKERGSAKAKLFDARWDETLDLYSPVAYDTTVTFPKRNEPVVPPDRRPERRVPELVEPILPKRGGDSVDTRELIHDAAADGRWWWTRSTGPATTLKLYFRNPAPMPPFVISSSVPALLPSIGRGEAGLASLFPFALLALPVIGFVAFSIARFIARRLFLVDLVPPLSLHQGYTGLRHVICHPCDDDSARRLFRDFRHIDLRQEAGLAEARDAPQSFDSFEKAVFVDGLGYACASGERSELVRALLDRLTRNSDRTVVIRPTTLTVITRSLLMSEHRDEWAKILASFVWVNWNQLVTSSARLTLSGPMEAFDPDSLPPKPPPAKRWHWRNLFRLSGFGAYFDQLTDARGAVERTVKEETAADPYLQGIMSGLSADATGRDQVLDEIGERAEEYYGALWNTCSTNEQLVLMQLAQTGLVNGKTRKDLRRLLARGLIRRDPQVRLMNETFRRFVLAQAAESGLAAQLEHDLARDAWSRFRVPIFASVGVVLLFFFTTQRQTFDSTIAMISGLAATLPLILKTLSGLGERGAKQG
jgi:hypothetical protein